jgi:hypothetical protein
MKMFILNHHGILIILALILFIGNNGYSYDSGSGFSFHSAGTDELGALGI